MDPHEITQLLRDAVGRQKVRSVKLSRVVPMQVGPPSAAAGEVRVHRFVAEPPVFYAWHDPTDPGDDRILIVRGSDRIRNAKAAVQAAVAHMSDQES